MPPRIPDHTLLRPIGRGAYGEVWLARNIMGAWRAVKVVRRDQFRDARPFEREFAGLQRYEPVSRSADGLVHVLHVGRDDDAGYFYYVMELADAANDEGRMTNDELSRGDVTPEHSSFGICHSEFYFPRTLRSELKRLGCLPTADCQRIALDVAGGLARLHEQGLVHRDVKPGNIIFVNGRAKLADLGLVAAGGEGRTFVGTEGYVPPEGPGTPGADLYALGCTIYEAATGLHADRFPDVPPEWLREGEGDDALEFHEVVLKCCEADPARRYRTAGELQADLALLQSGQSVRRVRQLEKRVQTLRRIGLLAALTVVTAVVVAIFFNWRANLAERQQAREMELRARAERAEHQGHARLQAAYTAQARATAQGLEAGRRAATLEAVRQAAVLQATPELRRHAFAALALADIELERVIDFGPDARGAVLDPNFTRYAVGRGTNTVEIHSLADTNSILRLVQPAETDARFPRFSADGRYLAFKRDRDPAGSDLEIWDLATTQRVVAVQSAVAKDALDWHPRRARLLVGRPDRRLIEWDAARREQTTNATLAGVPQYLQHAPDGTRVAVVRASSTNDTLEIRATDGALVTAVTLPVTLRKPAWHPDGARVAFGADDGKVRLFDTDSGQTQIIGEHNAQAIGTVFARGGDFLFTRGWDTSLNVWNLLHRRREMSLEVSAALVQVDAVGGRVAVFERHQARVFRFGRAPECRDLDLPLPLTARIIKFSPDRRWLCVDGNEGFGLWDLQQPGPAQLVVTGDVVAVGFTPDSRQFLAADNRRAHGWSLQPDTDDPAHLRWTRMPTNELPAWRRGPGDAHLFAWTNAADGSAAALAGADTAGALSPDGRWAARFSQRSSLLTISSRIAVANDLRLTNRALVRAAAFSPDSRTLAVLTGDELMMLDTDTWKPRARRPAAGKVFAHLAFSPDGRLLLATENTRQSALLDAATLEPILPFPEWHHPLAISPDGRWLVVRVEGRRTQLWDFVALRERFRELGLDW